MSDMDIDIVSLGSWEDFNFGEEDSTMEPTTENLSGEPTTENISDEPTTENISGESTTENISDEPTTENISGESTTENISGEPTTKNISDEPTTENISDEPTTENTANNSKQYKDFGTQTDEVIPPLWEILDVLGMSLNKRLKENPEKPIPPKQPESPRAVIKVGGKTASSNQFSSARAPIAAPAKFPAVRQHERRAHPVEYQRALEAKTAVPEPQLMEKIAMIEAKSMGGVISIKEVKSATGLTEHQIRHRREKPEYAGFLKRAREKVKECVFKTFHIKTSPKSSTFGQPKSVTGATSSSSLSTDTVSSKKQTPTKPRDASAKKAKDTTYSHPDTETSVDKTGTLSMRGKKRPPSSPLEPPPPPIPVRPRMALEAINTEPTPTRGAVVAGNKQATSPSNTIGRKRPADRDSLSQVDGELLIKRTEIKR
nr:uncharacterized protein DDB_G0284459-like [Onthophagus taurus]